MKGSDRLQRSNKIMSPYIVHGYLTDTNLRDLPQITEWMMVVVGVAVVGVAVVVVVVASVVEVLTPCSLLFTK